MPYFPIDYRSLLKRKDNEKIIKQNEEFIKMQDSRSKMCLWATTGETKSRK